MSNRKKALGFSLKDLKGRQSPKSFAFFIHSKWQHVMLCFPVSCCLTVAMNEYWHNEKKGGCGLSAEQQFLWYWREFDDSSFRNEDLPEASDDEEFVFVPFINHQI